MGADCIEKAEMIENKAALLEILRGLGDERSRAYEKQVTRLAATEQDREFENWLDELMAPSDAETAEEERVAFAAFAVQVTRLRRLRSNTEEKQLMERHRDRFIEHPFYHHLWLMCLLGNDPAGQYEDVLQLARDNCIRMAVGGERAHAGVYHALATAVADIFEALEFSDSQPEKKWLKRGEEAVREALETEGYPRFYCTKARLEALNGRCEEALRDIETAIDLEDPALMDYTLRIGEYRMYGQRIRDKLYHQDVMGTVQRKMEEVQRLKQTLETAQREMEHQQREMAQKQEKMSRKQEKIAQSQTDLEEKLQNTLTKNMEFLGLFAGIVSFTIGGIGIADSVTKASLSAAAGLIIVLMGALLGLFAGFGIILHGYAGEPGKRNQKVLGLGILITTAGVLLCLM